MLLTLLFFVIICEI